MTRRNQSGQTIIALLMFMLMAITITMAGAAITISNLQTGSAFGQGEQALANATTGAENALQQLERDPSYSGETMTLPTGAATITVSGTGTITIVSVGTVSSYHRTITVVATDTANTITETSWSETP